MDQVYLSVIIPAYNESDNLAKGVLDPVYDYLIRQKYTFELILVDDGSSDNTVRHLHQFAADKPQLRVLNEPHRGKAGAVKAGMMAARGENRLFTDFDQSTPIDSVEPLLKYRQNGYDICIGSREIAGAVRAKEPWYRHLMGRVFNGVVRLLAVRGIQDTQCGFKLFSADATIKLFPALKVTAIPKKDAFTGAFDVELLFLARRSGFKIVELPVKWKHMETKRVSPIKDSLRMFWEVVKIRWAHNHVHYGI